MFQSIRDFKLCYAMSVKYISGSKGALKLMLDIQIILSFNKIQLLQKQQLVNYCLKVWQDFKQDQEHNNNKLAID